ncbi:SemiSWEET transporter [uncultured Ilyobacter sp.]|jgi:MtN3 and saliva related transmembrane protein|uniref:SemiSWEET transporter n=1 Tax=uncultured Ilyobacter sp. TaxID=544433 RepID=UPI0029C0A8C0|nr:SemiSWEET transporter [uncultured Ilyobacter sp.]
MMEYVGFIAASLTTLSFLPQTIKIIKTRDTKSISLGMYMMFVLGVAFWLVYGLYTGDMPIILANFITLILSSVILVFKIKEVFLEK